MKYDSRIREEELKNRVAGDFFPTYDCTHILGNVDFSVCVKDDTPSLFDNDFLIWGEAKRGAISDFKTSFVQLILTIGKARTFDRYLPPRFLCEFDAKQIAFLPYDKILEVFYLNDFNWNVTPSDHNTREFSDLYALVNRTLEAESYIFKFDDDEKLLRSFIKSNIKTGGSGVARAKITKNNFISIYNRWLEEVKPTIQVPNWDALKKSGVLDADFFLADIMSKDNMPIMDKLQVLLLNNHYMLARQINESGLFTSSQAQFTDDGVAHARFWLKYERPPKKEYQEFILARRDLLVPQDIRERKGSYFTPLKWVELAQQYIERELGENWQDEYYVWDCCAGTGNLLIGLRNKYNIYASTIDKSDVDVIHERIKNGANLLPDHVFQMDFLNDGFSLVNGNLVDSLKDCTKIPISLRSILADPMKQKKLVIFANWPYAEVSSSSKFKGKKGVNQSKTHSVYMPFLGTAGREMYSQFIIRVASQVPSCYIAEFSKLKVLQGSAFDKFRKNFDFKLLSMFIVPANTFDNVKGSFPIGFKIWKGETRESFSSIESDMYDANGNLKETKHIELYGPEKLISKWVKTFPSGQEHRIGFLCGTNGNDFQHNNIVYILNDRQQMANPRGVWITSYNLLYCSIYNAVRHCVNATWCNDRDQFLRPDERYRLDSEFISDCFVWTLFENNISFTNGTNHWIPFSEEEVGSRERFDSHFMYDFLHNRSNVNLQVELFEYDFGVFGIEYSNEAVRVFDCGLKLWRYYHSMPDVNVNASLYDIRSFFQGFKENGHMNATSNDIEYTRLIGELRKALKALAAKIEPKVYEYGFLKR